MQQSRPNIIELRDVDRSFGGNTGVFDITIQVPQGSIFGMIGPSGCGKTTTTRLMVGLYEPERGSVRVLGQEPRRFSSRAREQLGYMPQQFVLYPNLTVEENLRFVASLYGVGMRQRKKRIDELLEFVELSDARRRLCSQLSGGMKRRLELAGSLIHEPKLLFADEPTAGIDPVLRGKFWDAFRNLRDQGRTLFVTTQYVGEAAYCDLVGVMREGRLLFIDTPEGLRRRALGGEIIQFTVGPDQARVAARILYEHPLVKDVRLSRGEPGRLQAYVEEASTALPVLIPLFEGQPNIQLQQAEEFRPPFDDVFIMLMERIDQQEEKRHV
ncbi:ABC transporter ATP-binding protein [Chloroflexia bacterium SDU3-3]|nr:ABC transporter ATP-binding protein [Chloroflexia bacterium SDU3-3]